MKSKNERIYYDKEVDAMHIRFGKSGNYAGTTEINDWFLIDKDRRGNLIGIEIFQVSRHFSKRFLSTGIKNGIINTYAGQKSLIKSI